MCLFKEKEFKEAKKLNCLVAGGIIAIALAIGLPFISNPETDLLPKFTLSQLAISAVGFIVVLIALCYTIVQFRKSIAKPKLEIFFNENKDTQTIIQDIPINKRFGKKIVDLWLLNSGNAVAKSFQLDLIIPKIFNPTLNVPTTNRANREHKEDNDSRIVSYYNLSERGYTLFVNRWTSFHSLVLEFNHHIIETYPDIFEIKYIIYGDWAETQEDTLKVKLIKESLNAKNRS